MTEKTFKDQIAEWSAKAVTEGFAGEATLMAQIGTAVSDEFKIGIGATEDVGKQTKIPLELIPYLKEILAERDNLLRARDATHTNPPTAADKASATLAAIEIIRARRKDELNATAA